MLWYDEFRLEKVDYFIRRFMGLAQIVAHLWCFLLNHIRIIRTYKLIAAQFFRARKGAKTQRLIFGYLFPLLRSLCVFIDFLLQI